MQHRQRSPWPRPNLALLGFMGAGKTATGRLVAARLGRAYVDVDEIVEKLTGASIEEIFSRKGEPFFRRQEHHALKAASRGEGTIIGCGGGVVLMSANRRILAERCLTVWLKASVETLVARLRNPDNPRRPLLADSDPESRVRELLHQREPLYRLSDVTVATDGRTLDDVASEVIARSERWGEES